MTYTLGVDLGTTFVAAAVARPTGVAMVPLGEQTLVASAAVAVRPDGSIVTGDAAERRAVSQPALVARGVKRRLGDPEPIRLGDRSYPVATLLGAQLRDVVQKAADREGEPAERVVLTYPVTWTPARRGWFDEIARAADLAASRLVTTAEAAAHHATPGRLAGGIVAVYDLGGGFEATVVRTRPDGPEILGTPEGVEGLGGADVDDAILSYVNDAMSGELAKLDMDDARTAVAMAQLRQDCVLAKETLSLDTEAVVPVFLPDRHVEIRLDRTTFEQILRVPLESTVEALSRTVRSAGLTPADVDAVLLVGGSSRIPLVAETVAREFGRPLLEGVNPMHAVALGAAALADVPAPAVAGGWAVPADVAPTAPRTAATPSDEVARTATGLPRSARGTVRRSATRNPATCKRQPSTRPGATRAVAALPTRQRPRGPAPAPTGRRRSSSCPGSARRVPLRHATSRGVTRCPRRRPSSCRHFSPNRPDPAPGRRPGPPASRPGLLPGYPGPHRRSRPSPLRAGGGLVAASFS